LKILINKLIGIIVKMYTNVKNKGVTINPKKKPNFIHNFKGYKKTLEKKIVKVKNVVEVKRRLILKVFK